MLYTILSKSVPYSLKTPPTSNAILGTISHKMLELRRLGFINSREEFKLKWKELIQEKESEIKAQFPTLKNLILADFKLCNEIWNIAQSITPEVISGSQYGQSNPFGPEKKVKLGNILIGYIDSVSSLSDGAEIIDYKTGKVHDEFGNIKEEYITQLSLYALMFEETFGMLLFLIGRLEKDACDLFEAFLLGHAGEERVARARLRFTGERLEQILLGLGSFDTFSHLALSFK